LGIQYYLYGTTCQATCPSGTYANSTSYVCANCNVYCTVCTGSSASSCSACANYSGTSYYLSGSICTATCPSGYNAIPITNLCSFCLPPCITCSGIATNCTSCYSSTYYLSSNNTCPSICPTGFFANTSTNNCDPCNPLCESCTGSLSTQCFGCANYSGISYYLSTTSCLTICPTGFFANTSTNKCNHCNLYCTICTGSTANECSACANYSEIAYLLTGTTCASSCPTFTYSNSTSNMCSNLQFNFIIIEMLKDAYSNSLNIQL
jgi:proprotein convertase subtilisin/kexin type 5